MLKEKPTMLILNEYYDKTIEASLFYKIVYPETKIILVAHVYRDLDWAFNEEWDKDHTDAEAISRMRYRQFLTICDYMKRR